MIDSHLNSVHLDFPRREDFRRARENLLGCRGTRTLSLEQDGAGWSFDGSQTMVQDAGGQDDELPKGMHYCLMGSDGIVPLKVGVNTIGRLPDNDVVVPTAYVSRRHCAILVHSANNCELHDIASKNGTFLNGRKLSGPTPLASGDEIRMCDQQFIFLSKHGPRRQDPAHDSTKAE